MPPKGGYLKGGGLVSEQEKPLVCRYRKGKDGKVERKIFVVGEEPKRGWYDSPSKVK